MSVTPFHRCMDMLAEVPGKTLEAKLTNYVGSYMALQIEVQNLRAELSAYAATNTNLRNDLVQCGMARDHHAALVEQVAWKPIDTAPKDGTPVLGFMPKYFRGKGGQSVILWLNIEWSDMGAHTCDPSHWMPLPPIPSTECGR